jgi:phage baseplate assembly protein W
LELVLFLFEGRIDSVTRLRQALQSILATPELVELPGEATVHRLFGNVPILIDSSIGQPPPSWEIRLQSGESVGVQ